MGIFSGNPKHEPMHYGEVTGVWSYLVSKNAMIAGYQLCINHTGDKDLKALLEDIVRSCKEEKHELEQLLKVNGIALPPAPPERPAAKLEAIPAGARFADNEICAMVSRDIAIGLVACSQVIGQCIREDIAALFVKYHAAKVRFGLRALRLSKEKGWLIPPPLHREAPEPAHV